MEKETRGVASCDKKTWDHSSTCQNKNEEPTNHVQKESVAGSQQESFAWKEEETNPTRWGSCKRGGGIAKKKADEAHRKRMEEIRQGKRKTYAGESFTCAVM